MTAHFWIHGIAATSLGLLAAWAIHIASESARLANKGIALLLALMLGAVALANLDMAICYVVDQRLEERKASEVQP